MLPCALSPAGAAPALALPVSAYQQATAMTSPALQTTEEQKQVAIPHVAQLLPDTSLPFTSRRQLVIFGCLNMPVFP